MKTLLAAGLLLLEIAQADAASMPKEIIGGWSPLPAGTGEACVLFRITQDGYQGSVEGEGYACRLGRIQPQGGDDPQNMTWTAELVCSGGESAKDVRKKSILHLRQFEGGPLLVVTEQTGRAADVLVLRRCKQ